ncbi:TetR family transcriptional regulator [Herbihabitans rhizosphaerae]|uniref:TetR family transcriptional regulator n=2 Tax=Herbihabitans rhizosphaerae TaxID=1872711 RepID=A0A4Q7KD51_9PSEU|nr:TetR family transcriptional regulator [Herbihabitans rhizosphaerae]
MSTEDRRAAIIEATLPLLAEHGMKVTTGQIAKAAGIAEGTVFRVFADKQELIQACVLKVMSPEEAPRYLETLPDDLELSERLSRVGHEMVAGMRRVGALMHALMATGYKPDRSGGQFHRSRQESLRISIDALTAVFEPEAASLRLPPRRAAQMFLGVIFSSQFTRQMTGRDDPHAAAEEGDEVTIDDLIDVFVHGVVKEETKRKRGKR